MSRDPVEEAGLESFPASDPPAWGKAAEGATPPVERKGQPGVQPKAVSADEADFDTGTAASRRRRAKQPTQKGNP